MSAVSHFNGIHPVPCSIILEPDSKWALTVEEEIRVIALDHKRPTEYLECRKGGKVLETGSTYDRRDVFSSSKETYWGDYYFMPLVNCWVSYLCISTSNFNKVSTLSRLWFVGIKFACEHKIHARLHILYQPYVYESYEETYILYLGKVR